MWHTVRLVVVALLLATPVWSANKVTTLKIQEGQLNVLGHDLIGDVQFTFTADSANILVTDQKGLSLPLIVRDPRDPVFLAGSEDPFISWRNGLADRLMAQENRPMVAVATEMGDSLRAHGCTDVVVSGQTITYHRTGDPLSTTWKLQRVVLEPRTFQLQRYLDSVLDRLAAGQSVYIVWSGRAINLTHARGAQLRQSCVALKTSRMAWVPPDRTNPDLIDLLRRPVNPQTLRQEEQP